MVALPEQLLPEEADVLARTGATALDVSAKFVVQDVFRAAAWSSAARMRTTRAAARSRSRERASARSRSSSRGSTPRSRWPARASAPRSVRNWPRS
jgi:hypothetical protein